MRYLPALALAVLFCLFSISSIAQLNWLNPKPSGFVCSKVVFTDFQNGYILNTNGDLLYTPDQGTNWTIRQNFPQAAVLDINASSGTGIIAGYNTIYISRDSGNTWQQKNMNQAANITMADVVSSDTIFTATPSGQIFRTDDGGNTWKVFNCGIGISSIEFINSKVGYIGGSASYILKTEDGGASWQQNVSVNISPSNTLVIKFWDINTGYAFRQHSTMLRTKDGGQTWQSTNVGDDIYSIFIVSETIAFATGVYGVLYRTIDGGASWNYIGPTTRYYAFDLNSLFFINSNIGFGVGSRGQILKTIDGGTTWNNYAFTYLNVNDLAFPARDTGYAAVGFKIYKSTDAGNNWRPLALTLGGNSSQNDVFQQMHFFSADTGIATASNYTRTYKTYDGGSTWKMINISQFGYEYVNDLKFIDKKTGFIAFSNYYGGMIAKTSDAGETWTPVWTSQYYGEYFQKIFFTDEKTGFASKGQNLYRTTDSAKTWTLLFGEMSKNISAIWFNNAGTGFVSGNNALLKRTIDSGKTWTDVQLPAQYYDDIYGVKFMNDSVGYFTAESAMLYKTTNGGSSWVKIRNRSYNNQEATLLPVITFGKQGTVYFAGEYGAILSTALCSTVTPPAANSQVVYCQNEVARPLVADGGNLNWYTVETGGLPSKTPPIPSTSTTGITPYWVSNVDGAGCESNRIKIDVQIQDVSFWSATSNTVQTLPVTGVTSFSRDCDNLITRIVPAGANPINGNTTARVWIENTAPANFVKRHYEITPDNNASTATARVTLYFKQAEFDAFNTLNTLKLPTGPGDAAGISRLVIEKQSGVSADGSGLPGTYTGTTVIIDPADNDIFYDATAFRWEVSFDVTGFSGFFAKSSLVGLPVHWLSVNATLTAQQQAVIKWTVQEANVGGYIIEKSTNGIDFNVIGSVDSRGDGINNYQFTETGSLINSAYFRVKQTDRDGKFSYSRILKLDGKRINIVTVYPNPFTSELSIAAGDELVNSIVEITDITGKPIKTFRLNGPNSIVDLRFLNSGVYFLWFRNGTVEKLVKY